MDDIARDRLDHHRTILKQLLSRIERPTEEDSQIKLIQNIDDRYIGVKRWRNKLRANDKPIDELPEELDTAVAAARQSLAALPLDHIPELKDLPTPNRMPLRSSSYFTGREDELRILAAALNATSRAAATGMPGIGKTQLASEFVHRYGQYFVGGVFWVSFADPQSIDAEIVACGRYMKLPDFDQQSDQQKVALVRAEWQKPIAQLLIFDNCEDEALLEKYQPTSGSCRLLITSRRNMWKSPDIQVHELQELSRTQSVTLLCKFRPDLPEDDATLAAIADELGNLPLALNLAGSYLKASQPDVTPDEYLADLRANELLEHPSLQDQDPADVDNSRLYVGRSFALSYDKLDTSKPAQMRAQTTLFCIAHYAPGESIPRRLLRDTSGNNVDATSFSATIQRLKNLGLITEEQDKDLRMHRLLAKFVRSQMRKHTARETEARNLVEQSLTNEVHQLNQQGAIAPNSELQPHLRYVADEALRHTDAHAAALCREAGIYFSMIEDYDTANRYATHALKIDENDAATPPPNRAQSLESMAYIFQRLGENEQARALYKEALALREQIVGEQHSDIARNLNKLALLDISEREYTEAQKLLERARHIDEQESGPDHLNTAETLNNLGVLFDQQNQYEKARDLYDKALKIRIDRRKQHLQTAETFLSLGIVFGKLKDASKAKENIGRANDIFESILGEKHPRTQQASAALTKIDRLDSEKAMAERFDNEDRIFKQRLADPAIDQEGLARSYVERAERLEKLAETDSDRSWLPLAQYLRGLAEQLRKEAPLDQ